MGEGVSPRIRGHGCAAGQLLSDIQARVDASPRTGAPSDDPIDEAPTRAITDVYEGLAGAEARGWPEDGHRRKGWVAAW